MRFGEPTVIKKFPDNCAEDYGQGNDGYLQSSGLESCGDVLKRWLENYEKLLSLKSINQMIFLNLSPLSQNLSEVQDS